MHLSLKNNISLFCYRWSAMCTTALDRSTTVSCDPHFVLTVVWANQGTNITLNYAKPAKKVSAKRSGLSRDDILRHRMFA